MLSFRMFSGDDRHGALSVYAVRPRAFDHDDVESGVLMERYELDAVRGFAVLRRLSMEGNIKLHAVATELVRSRALPPHEG